MTYLAEGYGFVLGAKLADMWRTDWRIALGVVAAALIIWGITQAVRFHRHVQEQQLEPPFGGVPAYASQQAYGQPLQLSEHAQPPYPPAAAG